jgi:hypothetical protein
MNIKLLILDFFVWLIGVWAAVVKWILALLVVRFRIIGVLKIHFVDHAILFAEDDTLGNRLLTYYYMTTSTPNIYDLKELAKTYAITKVISNYVYLFIADQRLTLSLTIDLETSKITILNIADSTWSEIKAPMGSIDVYELYRACRRSQRSLLEK